MIVYMKRLLLSLSLIFAFAVALAQQTPPMQCVTVEQDAVNRQKYPEMGRSDDFENALRGKIQEMELRRKAGRTQATLVTIPIVVHIVHNGENIGTGLNLSKAQVQSQIDVLNEDFRRKPGSNGFNTNPVGADIEIEFCLSPVDEDGNLLTEPGIDRIRGANTTWSRDQIEGSLKPTTIWNPNIFYNVWTLKFGADEADVLGYAQFPDQSGLAGLNPTGGPASTDGVVIAFANFGSAEKGDFPVMTPPYNRGRTMVHETGHWLGLRHIWGDGVCGNDFVDDTPTHRALNRGCPVTKVSCDGASLEMPQNYMDYSDESCMNIFTIGQKARMLAVMELSPRRKVLASSGLCAGTVVQDPPVADFTADKTTVLRGGEVVFTDLSSNFPSGWQWTFEGGDPNTSNVQNPHVKYSTPGTFRVSLRSSNSIGQSPVKTVLGYITVSEEGLCGAVTNYAPTFTSSLIKLNTIVPNAKGYLTGHNSAGSTGMSEIFTNPQGYKYISGVSLKFGKVYTTKENTTVTITVWNARGVQNGPGSIIERKTVLLRQIQDDITAGRATLVTFDRETPVFSKPFHVGMEITYNGDSLALESSANGEATNSTSWIRNDKGVWSPYTIAYGSSIAMNVAPIVGMNPSVQVSSSKLFVNPGEEVILNARGASIFVWNSNDNKIVAVPGPQLIVAPTVTTVYETSGSGLDLCNSSASTTVYVRSGPILGVNEAIVTGVTLHPNPGANALNITFENEYRGPVKIMLRSIFNQNVQIIDAEKSEEKFEKTIDTSSISSGVYITTLKIGEGTFYGKWVKN